MNKVELTKEDFDDVVAKNKIVVIDFWAGWCQPCKQFSTVFNKVAQQHEDKLFATVDIEAQPELAEEFSIRSIPFVMVIKNKTIIYADSGALTETALMDLVEQADVLDLEE